MVAREDVARVLSRFPPRERLSCLEQACSLARVNGLLGMQIESDSRALHQVCFADRSGKRLAGRYCAICMFNRLQPTVLPKQVAIGLTPTVRGAVATGPSQVHRRFYASGLPCLMCRLTGLVRDGGNAKALPAKP